MDDLDVVAEDLDNLPDDLYLDDVGVENPRKRYGNWNTAHSRRGLGRGRGKKRKDYVQGIDDLEEDDLLELDEHDLNSFDNWLLHENIDSPSLKEELSKKLFRMQRKWVRGSTLKRGQYKRGGGHRQFRNEGYQSMKSLDDVFDIESKSHHRSRFTWTRDDKYSHEEKPRRGSESLENEAGSPGYGVQRKDSRLFVPSQMKQSEEVDASYAPARKDPRLIPQQALAPRHPAEKSKPDFHPKQVEDCYGVRSSSEKGMEQPSLVPPGVETEEESEQKNIMNRRGHSSPSPLPPVWTPIKRSLSPPGKKRSISPFNRHSSFHRDHSPSLKRGSLSPRRHNWRGNSPHGWRRHSRSRSGSPRHRHSRDRSGSPRHRHSRDRSGSPRHRHSRDRSGSDRISPHRRSSRSRDESWRRPQGHYSHVQSSQQPFVQYSEDNYSGLRPSTQQYDSQTSAPPDYPNYQQYNYNNYYPNPPTGATYTGEYAQPNWSEGGMMYPDMSQPLPPNSGSAGPSGLPGPTQTSIQSKLQDEAKKEAVQNELIQQKQTLAKQREEYIRKKGQITKELQLLREQEEELLEENLHENDRILKENNKLQLEIQNKLKAINNVIDMLTGIIGDKERFGDRRGAKDVEKKKPKTPPDTPPQSSSSSETEIVKPGEKPVYNYVHYDPEMHWCRVCDVFPRTAKEYLNHLHSSEHKKETMERKLVDMPWHKTVIDEEVSHIPGAATKRTPIRGLQFFISATAWYCKLCDTWIGDLHCASLHLKSKKHAENYGKFTEQNPHWETDWLADREKASEKCSEERHRVKIEKNVPIERLFPAPYIGKPTSTSSKEFIKEVKVDSKTSKKLSKMQHKRKEKNCLTALEEIQTKKHDKKKQKTSGLLLGNSSSSSSSSSSSGSSDDDEGDKAKSIRVTMRNKSKAVKEQVQPLPLLPKSRWDSPPEDKVIKAEVPVHKAKQSTDSNNGDDKLIREWMSSSKDVSDGEKQLLNSIKDRLKQRHDAAKEKKDDRRDSSRGKRHSESPSSPSRSKRSRSSRFDRPHRSPERQSKRSVDKSEQKSKELPQKKSESTKKVNINYDDDVEEEDEGGGDESAESKFEKQTAKSAAKLQKKAKKPAISTTPKSKLPFIGRMPLLKATAKKKTPEEKKVGNADKKQLPQDPMVEAQYKLEFTNLGDKVRIGPAESSKTIGPELPATEHQVQDMDIDEDISHPVIETSVTTESPKKPTSGTGTPLPKDFQDALNILFPGAEGEKKEDTSSAVIQSGPKPPSFPPASQQNHWPPMMQGFAPSGAAVIGHLQGPQGVYGPHGHPPFGVILLPKPSQPQPQPPPPPPVKPKENKLPKESVKKSETVGEMSADDLAMLGIDVDDMAAQSF